MKEKFIHSLERNYYNDRITPSFWTTSIHGEKILIPAMKLCDQCGKAREIGFFKIEPRRKCNLALNCFDCALKRADTFRSFHNSAESKFQERIRQQTRKLLRSGKFRGQYTLIKSCPVCAAGYPHGGGRLELHHEVYSARSVYWLCQRHHKQLESTSGRGLKGLVLWPEIAQMPHTQACRNAMEEFPEDLQPKGRSARWGGTGILFVL